MSSNPNSPFDGNNPTPSSEPKRTSSPVANDLFRANQAANERHVGPTTTASVIASYQPSGRIGAFGFPLLILCLVVVPFLGALLYEKLWHFGGMLLISPIFLGLLVGGLVFGAVHLGKVRHVALATIVGALVGLATFGLAMGMEAWEYRPQIARSYASYLTGSGQANPQQAQATAEAYLTPFKTAQIYWKSRAAQGVNLTSTRGRTTSNVSGPLFWVLEGFECLIVVLFGAIFGATAAKRRFSEEFDRWYITKAVYGVHPPYVPALLEAANASEWESCRLVALQPGTQSQKGAGVTCAYIPEKPGGIATISAIADTRKGLQPVFERELSNEELKALWPEFPMPNKNVQPFSS